MEMSEETLDTHVSLGSTYMSQICNKIFIFNSSEGQIHFDEICHNWFLGALHHCSETLFLHPEPRIHVWLFKQVMNFGYMIFPQWGDTELIQKKTQVRLHPYMLTRSDCNHLFIDVARDYIDIAPKYVMCLENSAYAATFLQALLGIISLIMMFNFMRKFIRKNCNYSWGGNNNIFPSKILSGQQKEALRTRIISDRSLSLQKVEVKQLKVDDYCPKTLIYDPPFLAIKVKKKHLSDALCCLVKSDPIAEEQKNGTLRQNIPRSRNYAINKLNLFLNRRSYFRLILDIGYDEDGESDIDILSDSIFPKKCSLGDSVMNESTIDDSAETSSVSSARNHTKSLDGTNRAKRQNSKFRQMYLQSIRTGKKSQSDKDQVTEKMSANSVTVVKKKDSGLVPGREFNFHGCNKGRSVKTSKL